MRLELTVMEGECAEGETARHHHLHLHIRENTYIPLMKGLDAVKKYNNKNTKIQKYKTVKDMYLGGGSARTL